MSIELINFKGEAGVANNDKIHERLYSVDLVSYSFLIEPRCRFWRWGMRFSKTRNVRFSSLEDRHNNKNYIDIHLGSGMPSKSNTHNQPSGLHFVQYHLKEFSHNLAHYSDYSQQPVTLSVMQNESRTSLIFSLKGDKLSDFNILLPLEEYKYFKLFAWADWADFDINCTVTDNQALDLRKEESKNLEKQFQKGNITFRLGDLFDSTTINRCDLVLLPADSSGSITDSIRARARELGIPVPPPNLAGSILTYQSRSEFLQAGFAYSVDSGSSSPEIIRNVCKNILPAISPTGVESIGLPLFGTGAGNISGLEVAKIYVDEFNASKFSFIVSIIDEAIYNLISSEFSTENSFSSGDIKAKLHSDVSLDEEDVLNFDLIAENLFTILTDNATNPPLNIGILAPWGRGKTSLLKRIKQKFDSTRQNELKKIRETIISNPLPYLNRLWKTLFSPKEKEERFLIPSIKTIKNWLQVDKLDFKLKIPYATIWFNPWNYQSTEMIWGGLAYSIIEQSVSQIPDKAQRELFRLHLRLARLDKEKLRNDLQLYALRLICAFVVLSISSIAFFLLAFMLSGYWMVAGFGLLFSAVHVLYKYLQKNSDTVIKKLKSYDKKVEYLNKLGSFHEVESDLKKVFDCLIDKSKPIIIFVDDLDRCSPGKIVEVVEAINVFMNSDLYKEKCYFILGMDAEVVAAALDVSYEKMKGKMGSREIEQGSVGWYFLDKFIQLPFFIPVMSESKKQEYLSNLFDDGDNIDSKPIENVKEDDEKIEKAFNEIMATDDVEVTKAVIDSLSNEEKKSLDKKVIRTQVQAVMQNQHFKEQMVVYAKFISSDPRSLKRFANLLRFYSSYQFLKSKRGEPSVEPNVLAKWLIIMLKYPQLIRWLQWNSENKAIITDNPESKALIMDDLLKQFIQSNKESSFENWLTFELPSEFLGLFVKKEDSKQVKDFTDMPWLKSKNFYDILLYEVKDETKFQNALACNVW